MRVNGLALQPSLRSRGQNVSDGTFFPPEIDVLGPNPGSYRLCYQYNRLGHNGLALEQRGVTLSVVDSASLIHSISPTRGAAGKNLDVNFHGLQASPYVVVAFSAPGQCNISAARVWSATLSESLTSTVNIADAGVFSVCVSLSGRDGEFVEQRNIKMTIMGLASSTSITHIDPDRTAVGTPTLLSLSGLAIGSEFTYVAFTSVACSEVSEESLLELDETLRVRVTFQVSATQRVCLSTSGKNTSALVYQPLVSMTVIASALQALVTGIYPKTMPIGIEFPFSISSFLKMFTFFTSSVYCC